MVYDILAITYEFRAAQWREVQRRNKATQYISLEYFPEPVWGNTAPVYILWQNLITDPI